MWQGDGSTRVRAGDDGWSVEVLGVADFILRADSEKGREVDENTGVEAPVEDGDVGSPGFVLVGTDENLGPRESPRREVGVSRVVPRRKCADATTESVACHREAAGFDQHEILGEIVVGNYSICSSSGVTEITGGTTGTERSICVV